MHLGAPGWFSGWASAFGSVRDPGVLGSSPALGSLWGACFSLCRCLCPSLCVSHEKINKIFKKKSISIGLFFFWLWVILSCLFGCLVISHCMTNIVNVLNVTCSFFKKRFYLPIYERHRERQRHRQREKQAPCREPDVGLNPGTRITTWAKGHWAIKVPL